MDRHRRALVQALPLALVPAVAARTWAQPAGDKTIHFILPNAAGSGVDAITRAAQGALGRALGGTVVVDNQPGAGGIVGVQALARAAPDGLTLGVVSNNVVIFPSMHKALPFELPADITPIAIVGTTPLVVVVNARVPAASAKELMALLKAKPGALNYGSGGIGTILHLASEMLLEDAQLEATHVPYKGVGPMVSDLVGGQIDFAAAALPSVQQHLETGALKAIGVATAERVPAAPEIPTFVEQGLPGYVMDAWFAVVGPKNLPPAEARRINAAVAAAFAEPGVKEAMAKQGNVIAVGTPEQAQAFFRSELARYARLVKKAGIPAQ